jgi:hypothetical protein
VFAHNPLGWIVTFAAVVGFSPELLSSREDEAGARAERDGHGRARRGPARPLHRYRGEGNAPIRLALLRPVSPALPTPALPRRRRRIRSSRW